MITFVIHRTAMRADANAFLRSLSHTHGIHIDPVFLKKSHGDRWQQQAESMIQSSEAVIIYDSKACASSENTTWEINHAKELGKPVVVLSNDDIASRNMMELQSVYDFSAEFDCCFENQSTDPSQLLELYKIMVTSSEQLIQRRQITNGFFITVIGAIVGASSLLLNEKVLIDSTVPVLVFP